MPRTTSKAMTKLKDYIADFDMTLRRMTHEICIISSMRKCDTATSPLRLASWPEIYYSRNREL